MDINKFVVDAVTETFETMIFMDVSAGDTTTDDFQPIKDGVSGTVGLAGNYQGLVCIHLPSAVAMAITGAFLGMEVSSVDEDVKDAIGELANMVGGSIKFMLPEEGKDTKLSIPSVITGQMYTVDVTKKANNAIVPFRTEHGDFIVTIQLMEGQ